MPDASGGGAHIQGRVSKRRRATPPRRGNEKSAATSSNSDPINAEAFDNDRLCTITLRCCKASCAVLIHLRGPRPPWTNEGTACRSRGTIPGFSRRFAAAGSIAGQKLAARAAKKAGATR